MKLIEHVYAIKNLVSSGIPSDDHSYSERFIAHLLSVSRAMLIERKADKYSFISDQSFQTLCVAMELGSFHNCCEGPQDDCKILKSVVPLPKMLTTRWGNFIKVMYLDGEVIPETSISKNRFTEFSLTDTKLKDGWFINDNHLYILNNKELVLVLMNGLFSDPNQIAELNCSTTNSDICPDYLSEEFPIDADLIDPMYKMTLEILLTSYKLPKDEINNAREDKGQESR